MYPLRGTENETPLTEHTINRSSRHCIQNGGGCIVENNANVTCDLRRRTGGAGLCQNASHTSSFSGTNSAKDGDARKNRRKIDARPTALAGQGLLAVRYWCKKATFMVDTRKLNCDAWSQFVRSTARFIARLQATAKEVPEKKIVCVLPTRVDGPAALKWYHRVWNERFGIIVVLESITMKRTNWGRDLSLLCQMECRSFGDASANLQRSINEISLPLTLAGGADFGIIIDDLL